MASFNKQSVREEFDKIKASFDERYLMLLPVKIADMI